MPGIYGSMVAVDGIDEILRSITSEVTFNDDRLIKWREIVHLVNHDHDGVTKNGGRAPTQGVPAPSRR